jgi:WD40-like Beta Propeller Repeat
MMIRKSLIITALLLLFSAAASAQDSTVPLIVVPLEGDTNYIYENGQFKPMDFCLTGNRPSFFAYAPSGQQFAFLGMPDSDIWVCNLPSRAAQMIADKTPLARSLPVWSPDGTRIAWAQSDQATNNMQVIVHDLAAAAQTILYERQERSVAFVVPSLDWGAGGLVFYDLLQPENGDAQAVVVTIDTASNTVTPIPLPAVGVADYARWISTDEKDYILLRNTPEGEFIVIDPATSHVTSLYGQLAFFSRTAPDALNIYSTRSVEIGTYEWAVAGTDFSTALNLKGNEYGIAISPDGAQIAFVTFESYPWGGKAYVMNDFSNFPPVARRVDNFTAAYSEPGILYVFWSPLAIRIMQ